MVFLIILAPFFLLGIAAAMLLFTGPIFVILFQWARQHPVKAIMAFIASIGVMLLVALAGVMVAPPGKEHVVLFFLALYVPAALGSVLGLVMLTKKEHGKGILLLVLSWCYSGLVSPWLEFAFS